MLEVIRIKMNKNDNIEKKDFVFFHLFSYLSLYHFILTIDTTFTNAVTSRTRFAHDATNFVLVRTLRTDFASAALHNSQITAVLSRQTFTTFVTI